MKIKWYGHAAFHIVTATGIKIIIDPYESGSYNGALSYGKIEEEADIVLTSHDHADHNYVNDIYGNYTHINKEGEYEAHGVKIKAIPTFHDNSSGKERGDNLIFVIMTDGLSLVHAGDIGHALDAAVIGEIGKPDILLLPVGGFFTIGAKEAEKMINELQPKITIPMHYKTDKCAFPIAPVDEFVKGRPNVRLLEETEVEITKQKLPDRPQILVLQHAL
ncbi:MAG TPA: MBL fold metallo-hydrolase [Deltaproteobacteria bacterium]|nr:MBL fold metallo-hydrolase [Deltaproteobacteria bacterium]